MILALTDLWLRNAPLVAGSCILMAWTLLVIFVSALVFDHRGWQRARRAVPAQLKAENEALRQQNNQQQKMLDRWHIIYMRACERMKVDAALAHAILNTADEVTREQKAEGGNGS
jgi:hypothetical protein